MGSIKEFWSLARRRPLTAVSLGLAITAFSLGSYAACLKLEEFINPPTFNNLSGDYSGTIAESGAIHLCFAAFGPRVLGEMTLDGGTAHVDYWGSVDKAKNQLTLHYIRAVGLTSPDHGDAVLSQIGKDELIGYYQSTVYPDNHQTLALERTLQPCDLKHFDHGW